MLMKLRSYRNWIIIILIFNGFFFYFTNVSWFSKNVSKGKGSKAAKSWRFSLFSFFAKTLDPSIDVDQYIQVNYSAIPCQGPIFLTMLINSAPHHVVRRDAIRQTWGNTSSIVSPSKIDHRWRVLFLIGKTHIKKVDNAVIDEALLRNDIIIIDLHESYKNLTQKTLIGMDWIRQYCPKSEFYFKGDDDVFVNSYRLLQYLESIQTQTSYRNTMIGRVARNNRDPCRNKKGKYYVSYNDYPYIRFPAYCSGFAYVMPIESLHKLLWYVNSVKKIPMLDDVYIGILANYAGVRVIGNNKRFHFYHPTLPKKHKFKIEEVNIRLAEHGIGTYIKQKQLLDLAKIGLEKYH